MTMQESAKRLLYEQVAGRIGRLIAGQRDMIAVMATVVCELHHGFAYFDWTGFYRVAGPGLLKVGPYQGGHGCLEITFDRGVCGAAASSGETQLVPDVREFPGHIACSASTRSEIVVPVADSRGGLIAVLDIDSDQPGAFDEIDRANLEELCAMIGRIA